MDQQNPGGYAAKACSATTRDVAELWEEIALPRGMADKIWPVLLYHRPTQATRSDLWQQLSSWKYQGDPGAIQPGVVSVEKRAQSHVEKPHSKHWFSMVISSLRG